jgi:hypothetical protein
MFVRSVPAVTEIFFSTASRYCHLCDGQIKRRLVWQAGNCTDSQYVASASVCPPSPAARSVLTQLGSVSTVRETKTAARVADS